jgi:hypothetical protein
MDALGDSELMRQGDDLRQGITLAIDLDDQTGKIVRQVTGSLDKGRGGMDELNDVLMDPRLLLDKAAELRFCWRRMGICGDTHPHQA